MFRTNVYDREDSPAQGETPAEERTIMKKFLVIMSSLFFISFILGRFSMTTQALVANRYVYDAVKVGEEDDLDSIAGKYNNIDDLSHSEYKRELEELNDLTDEVVIPGCYITVFYSPQSE